MKNKPDLIFSRVYHKVSQGMERRAAFSVFIHAIIWPGAGAYVKKPYVMEKIGTAIRDELTIKCYITNGYQQDILF